MSAPAPGSKTKRVRLSEKRAEMQSGRFRNSYDAAQTHRHNTQHWDAADALSANAAHNPTVRAILRNRSRYEHANNSHARGNTKKFARYVVGSTGPRLQALLESEEQNDEIEERWQDWAKRIRLARKLRTAVMTRKRDGEVFLQRFTNWGLRFAVKLDLNLIEGDQVATPGFGIQPNQITDGIIYDDFGNPMMYHVLRRHPGELYSWDTKNVWEKDDVPASEIVHLFTHDRPGQRRGVPECVSALSLCANSRRYSQAVIAAAEEAANIAGLLTVPAMDEDEDGQEAPAAGDEMQIPQRSILTVYDGQQWQQIKAEQPATTYEMFTLMNVGEIAVGWELPFIVATGNAGKANFASAQVDLQDLDVLIDEERETLEIEVLDWLFEAWYREAVRIPGYFRTNPPRDPRLIRREYFWPGREHADPNRESSGQERRLNNLLTTLAHEYSRKGRDWRRELRQYAKEEAYIRELGLTRGQATAALAGATRVVEEDDPDDETEGDDS